MANIFLQQHSLTPLVVPKFRTMYICIYISICVFELRQKIICSYQLRGLNCIGAFFK
jgi:hypothetical protein